jgi:hypothetical protein
MSKILANEIANYGDNAPIDLKEGLNIPAGKPIQAAGSAGSSGQILSTTGSSIAWVTPFDGSYNSLTNRPSIPAAQVNSDWNASGGVAVILNKPSVPPLPSVTTAAASGGGSLSYNGANGEFTFTPASISPNWDTAYGWGNHANAGYITAEADTLDTVIGRGATTSTKIIANGGVRGGTLSSGSSNDVQLFHTNATHKSTLQHLNTFSDFDIKSVTDVNIIGGITEGGGVNLSHTTNAGDNAVVRLQTTAGGVTINGSIEMGSGNLTTTGKILYANNYDTLGDLPGASTYHGMFAHVHGTGKGYFAHAGAWTELLDVNSSMADLGDVDLTVAPTDGQVLKWEQSSGSWKAANDLTGGGGGGLALTDLSASTATASGGGSLSYNSGSGAFTFTPPDLSSYLTTETDPVFLASDAAAVTSAQITNWNSAYAWGNHGSQGYLVGYGAVSNHTDVNITGASNSQLLQYNGTNWVNWTPNYISSETDTLATVTGRGAQTNNAITIGDVSNGGDLNISAGNDNYLKIFASGNEAYIRNIDNNGGTGGGGLNIAARTTLGLYSGGTGGSHITFVGSSTGTAGLYYQSLKKLETSSTGVTVTGALTSGSFVKSGGTSSEYLMADGSVTTGGGGGGASVTISDTPPAATAGDLWWESDTGRLKIYYQDTDTTQWVDTNPPLTQDRIASSSAPSSATDTGTPGDIRYDSGYVYICISNNTWKRAALTTW